MKRQARTLAQWFDAHLPLRNTEPESCWEWKGHCTPDGYGSIHYKGKNLLAHRVALLYFEGRDAGTLCVLHRCDNRPCVRPSHLFIGDRAENCRDMWSKGRGKDRTRHTYTDAVRLPLRAA